MNNNEHFKSGFVAVVGRPNVGKSTLINALIGDKIAIVSDKAQTTRNRIICVYTDERKQIVFMDTPGVHKPKHKLGEFMVDAAIESLKETEAVLFVVAGNEKRGPGDNFIIEQLQRVKVPVFLVVNKIDTLKKEELLEAIVSYQNAYPFAGVIPISAKEETGIDKLEKTIQNLFYEGSIDFNDEVLITNVRHKTALQNALNSLNMVKQSIENQMPEDFLTIDLMDAYEQLGTIIGEAVEDDLVNEIFSKFCMGK